MPLRLEPDRHDELHPVLDSWRGNVGDPVAIDSADDAPPVITGIDVLCWNIAIGLGRLGHVVEQLRAGAFDGAGIRAERPLVILVQEAFRGGEAVPSAVASSHHGGKSPGGRRVDIAEIAIQCGLSLRYSPSMRNGTHASDRGNAVLSTVRLAEAEAFLLPYVRQRRVVVGACMAGHPQVRFVSAHLDTHGAARDVTTNARLGSGRAAQARALGATLSDLDASVVLGADLNSLLGMSDPAVRELVRAGMHPARRVGAWRHTFHTRVRLLLDHVMYRCPGRYITGAEVMRLDEAPGDRSRAVFGSDHHPLLARLDLRNGA